MADARTHAVVRDDALEQYLDRTAARRLESFKDFLRIPSISGISAHTPDCRSAAEFVAGAAALLAALATIAA